MTLRLFVFCAALFAGILVLNAWDADAARLGGGKSFGGKSFMSKPAAPPTPAPGLNKAPSQAGGPGAAAAAPSRFGGMGGMLGGLLAGTLLGSLLFGGGFEGGGMMDILLIGLLAFLAFKLFSRRRTATAGGPQYHETEQVETQQAMQRSGTSWDHLRSQPQGGASMVASGGAVPADFDSENFLRGAKMAYNRLQASWDKRDLNDIAQFASPAVMDEINAQAQADPAPSSTEVLLINAQLLSVKQEGAFERASVFFDVLLREDPKANDTAQAREVWHFMRKADGGDWKLDGIQQVE